MRVRLLRLPQPQPLRLALGVLRTMRCPRPATAWAALCLATLLPLAAALDPSGSTDPSTESDPRASSAAPSGAAMKSSASAGSPSAIGSASLPPSSALAPSLAPIAVRPDIADTAQLSPDGSRSIETAPTAIAEAAPAPTANRREPLRLSPARASLVTPNAQQHWQQRQHLERCLPGIRWRARSHPGTRASADTLGPGTQGTSIGTATLTAQLTF